MIRTKPKKFTDKTIFESNQSATPFHTLSHELRQYAEINIKYLLSDPSAFHYLYRQLSCPELEALFICAEQDKINEISSSCIWAASDRGYIWDMTPWDLTTALLNIDLYIDSLENSSNWTEKDWIRIIESDQTQYHKPGNRLVCPLSFIIRQFVIIILTATYLNKDSKDIRKLMSKFTDPFVLTNSFMKEVIRQYTANHEIMKAIHTAILKYMRTKSAKNNINEENKTGWTSHLGSTTIEKSIVEKLEKHETLNPKLWSANEKLKSEVEQKIIQIVDEFTDLLAKDGISLDIKDIILVGSNCSYNYTEDSDLDIHLVVNTANLDCSPTLYALLYSTYKSLFNHKFDISFYGIPVELYIETENVARVSSGCYSVLDKKWIKYPDKAMIPEIDTEAFDTMFNEWEQRYKTIVADMDVDSLLNEDLATVHAILDDQIRGEWEAIKNYKKAITDLKTEKADDSIANVLDDIADEEKVHVGELEQCIHKVDSEVLNHIEKGRKEGQEKLAINKNETTNTNKLIEEIHTPKIDAIVQFIEDAYALRKNSLINADEFDTGNLVFKELRNKGYLDILKELKNKLIAKELSLTSSESKPIKADEIPDTTDVVLNEENEVESKIPKYLTNQQIEDLRLKLTKICHCSVILQENGRFDIYNLLETDANIALNALRQLDFIDYVYKTGGRATVDFSLSKLLPMKYKYNIYGQIKIKEEL